MRDLLLAGGALTVLACSEAGGSGGGCCNAVSDPCCAVDHCGVPLTAECACARDGGVYDTTGAGACNYASGVPEAGTDGRAGDAGDGGDAGDAGDAAHAGDAGDAGDTGDAGDAGAD